MYDPDIEKPKNDEDRHRLMRHRFKLCVDRDNSKRNRGIEDFKFIWVSGEQWNNTFGRMRGDGRIKLEINKLRQAVKQVVNDMRMNTPAIKVRATEDGSVKVAEMRQGMVRNIEAQSKADEAYDWAGLYAISAGFGVIRVNRKYVDDNTFDQEIRIERVHNPFSVWFDPAAVELDRSDARYAFVEDKISKAEFEERWPNKDCTNFDTPLPAQAGWYGESEVRIAEYWKKVNVEKELLLLSDGRVVDAEGFPEESAANPPLDEDGNPIAEPVTVVRRRKVEGTKVTMEIVSGKETLEGPFDWPGKYIPLAPVWGDIVHVDGEDEWYGMGRFGRDPQMMYNLDRSNLAEGLSKQPSAPFLYTATHTSGYEKEWANLAVDNAAGLPYNPDPQVPGGMPVRAEPPQISQGFIAACQISSQELKDATGIQAAGLGQRSNETSGRAILARQREGDIANFDYQDNIARAILYVGQIVNDLIPHVYDTERQIRILGEDGSEDFIEINKPVFNTMTQEWETVNDIRQGKYDVSISTGPSFTTQRMETLEAFMQLAQGQGPQAILFQYGVLKNLDTPGLDEVRDAFRKQLVGMGMLEPSEGDQPPQPPQPNPKDIAGAEKDAAQAANYAAQAQGKELDNQQKAFQLGMQMGQLGVVPPIPQQSYQEPAPGGFPG